MKLCTINYTDGTSQTSLSVRDAFELDFNALNERRQIQSIVFEVSDGTTKVTIGTVIFDQLAA